jgi:retron-type reverse transcriptase
MESNLSLRVRRRKNIERAWAAIKRNSRTSKSIDTRKEIAAFEENLVTNLQRISRQLQLKKFRFAPARGVKIPKTGGFRPLVVAKVECRIVQRAVHDVLLTVPGIQEYVQSPYSFGGVRKGETDELAAVPAAIRAVLTAIGEGGSFVIRSDISQFFTRIRKSSVVEIVKSAAGEGDFIELFAKAIKVELANMAELRGHASAFPIEDIGVAQGNSLSPLLGNVTLCEFDLELNNQQGVRCIRYIDDFIIIATDRNLAETAYSKGKQILSSLGMELSPGKTVKAPVEHGFEFLGIELANGLIRPSKKAQQRLLASIHSTFKESAAWFREHHRTGKIKRPLSLLESLKKVDGVMQGWGKHYRFCNDGKCFEYLDSRVMELMREYLGIYREEREKAAEAARWNLLGIESLSQIERKPFEWPKKNKVQLAVSVK